GASPGGKVHGGNGLSLPRARPISRETLRTGAHATGRRIDRSCTRHFAGKRGRNDNPNRGRIFPFQPIKIDIFIRAIFLGAVAVVIASCAAPDTRHHVVISTREQKLALLDRGNLMAIYPVSTSKFGLGDWPGSSCTPLGELEIAKKIGDHATPGTVFK